MFTLTGIFTLQMSNQVISKLTFLFVEKAARVNKSQFGKIKFTATFRNVMQKYIFRILKIYFSLFQDNYGVFFNYCSNLSFYVHYNSSNLIFTMLITLEKTQFVKEMEKKSSSNIVLISVISTLLLTIAALVNFFFIIKSYEAQVRQEIQ